MAEMRTPSRETNDCNHPGYGVDVIIYAGRFCWDCASIKFGDLGQLARRLKAEAAREEQEGQGRLMPR